MSPKRLRNKLESGRFSHMNESFFIQIKIVVAFLFCFAFFYNLAISLNITASGSLDLYSISTDNDKFILAGPCAINLYGLPRKFKDLVLPGLIENVIRPNAQYQCDYFVHYYDKRIEIYDRGADFGRKGMINPDEIKLLSEAVLEEHRSTAKFSRNGKSVPPIVHFAKETEANFLQRYSALIHRIHNERGSNGKLLFMPLNELEPYPNDTITNIIKMWHSQHSVYEMMECSLEGHEQALASPATPVRYSRVAMIRSDVLFVTPVDIYRLPDGSLDVQNKYAVIPDFSKFPVNDRMIYGPADAVQIWATGKFQRMRRHAERVAVVKPGDGIHPERFLYHTIFPAIRDAGIEILNFPSDKLCFLRVRSDSSVRASDCGRACVSSHNLQVVQHLLKRQCLLNTTNPDVAFFECHDLHKSVLTGSLGSKLSWKGCASSL